MIERYRDLQPVIDARAWVHASAVVIGDVTLEAGVGVWPGVILRGDQGAIHIGEETNLQDGTIAHATGGLSEVWIGPRVTVGHRVLLHGCRVERDALIGMGAIVLDNAVVEPWSIVGAGTLVPVGRRVPSGSLFLGVPGRVVRRLREEDLEMIRHGHEEYMKLLHEYREKP